MATLKITKEVPDDSCKKCAFFHKTILGDKSSPFTTEICECVLFENYIYNYKRCKACLDAAGELRYEK